MYIFRLLSDILRTLRGLHTELVKVNELLTRLLHQAPPDEPPDENEQSQVDALAADLDQAADNLTAVAETERQNKTSQ